VHLERAQQALEASEFEGAISSAEHALLLDPDNPTAAEIIDHARAALDEHSVQELVKRASELIEAGSLTEALGLCEQALTIAPGSAAAVELRDTLDRLRLERERERQRLEAVHLATDRARSALVRGDYEEALAAAEEVLRSAPASETATQIRHEAEDGIARAQQAVLDRLAADTADEARRVFEAGEHDRALEILSAFEGDHPHVAETLEALTGEKARLQREAERARRQRVEEAMARASSTASHEEAIADLREALAIDPTRADAAGLLAEHQHALEAEREEARQALERERIIAERLSSAAGEASHEAAIAILESLGSMGAGREGVRAALEGRRAALELQREEIRRAEALRRRIETLLNQAKQSADHEAAIALLEEARALDAGRRDVEDALKAREAALTREREERRRAEERAARITAAVQQADATGSDEEALEILNAAFARDPDPQLKTGLDQRQAALARKQEEARRARETEARVAAAIAKASAAPSHEAAIDVLAAALEHDPGHADLTDRLAGRRASLEQQKQEERERREREARERREQVAAAITRARTTASHAEAIAILEQAAALDPRHDELRAVLSDRRAALEREREEARRERAREERIAAAIRDAKRAPGSEAALAILQRALVEAPDHEELRGLAATAEATLAREREEARKLRERQARVAALLDEAKKTASHERAIEVLREILQLEPGHRESQGLLERRLASVEEERAEARRQAGIETARRSIGEAIAAGDLERAEAVLKAAEQTLAAAKLLKTERARLKEARAAAERAAAEKAAADKAAAEQAAAAKAAAEKAAAEKAAAAKAAADKAAAEKAAAAKAAADKAAAEKAAAAKAAADKAAAEKAAAEKAAAERAAAEKAAAAKAAEEKAARDKAAAEKAAAARAAADRAAAERAAARRSDEEQPAEWTPTAARAGLSSRTLAITGFVAALAVLLVVGYFTFRGGQDSGTGAPAKPPVAQGPNPNPTPSGPAPQTAPPTGAATEPPRTTGGPASTPTAPVPETPPPNALLDSKVAGDLKAARESLQRGQLQAAADAIVRGMRVEPRNQALRQLGRTIAGQARQATSDARTRATGQSQAAAGSPPFRDAQTREVEAGKRERADQYDRAVRLYAEAARLYGDAARTAPAPRPETPVVAPPETTKPSPAPPPPAAPPPAPTSTQPGAGSSSAGAATPATPSAAGGTGASGGTTPPATTPSPPPPSTAKPTPPAPAQPSIAAEEAAIRATLREYAAAYESLSVDAVRRVYPTVNAEALARSFRELSSQQVQISGDDKITIDGATAVVRCTVVQSFTPRVGQGRRQNVQSVFRLQKTGGRWVIVERR
jgi:tetratricopeptide (TPR) repeat protein